MSGGVEELRTYSPSTLSETASNVTSEVTSKTTDETSSETTLAERIESLKAGAIGAGAIVLAWVGLTILLNQIPAIAPAVLKSVGYWSLGISVGSVALSGFLFGVTYRYVIRRDRNPHLRSGAVLAFGLVRGLALVETCWPHEALLPLVLLPGESILLFAGVRWILDGAMQRGWVQAFPARNEP